MIGGVAFVEVDGYVRFLSSLQQVRLRCIKLEVEMLSVIEGSN